MAFIEKGPTLENIKIMYRNFSGNETQTNREGKRNFCAIIPDVDVAQALINDGWNVKIRTPKDEDDDLVYYLPVEVSWTHKPPHVYMVTGRNKKTQLYDDTVECLDYADIISVDLIVSPYNWTAAGKSGVKAFVKEMWVVVQEDHFASKYDEEQEDDVEPF